MLNLFTTITLVWVFTFSFPLSSLWSPTCTLNSLQSILNPEIMIILNIFGSIYLLAQMYLAVSSQHLGYDPKSFIAWEVSRDPQFLCHASLTSCHFASSLLRPHWIPFHFWMWKALSLLRDFIHLLPSDFAKLNSFSPSRLQPLNSVSYSQRSSLTILYKVAPPWLHHHNNNKPH